MIGSLELVFVENRIKIWVGSLELVFMENLIKIWVGSLGLVFVENLQTHMIVCLYMN